MAGSTLAEQLLAVLPQTQCTRCGYPDCAGYAQAMAQGQASINQCPPGGAQGIARLALLTSLPASGLNPDHGLEGPRKVVFIDEAWCIGCTLCAKVCPTDAILGSNKLMHTVIEAYCTGCELCLPVCPVDCIVVQNVTGERTGWAAWSQELANVARDRYAFHSRAARPQLSESSESPALTGSAVPVGVPDARGSASAAGSEQKRRVIEETLQRVRSNKSQATPAD